MLSPRRLQVPAAFNAPVLDGLVGLEVVPGRVEDRRSALYDTAELDLTRWGVRIEHDTQHGWRIELPEVATVDRHVRVLNGGASVPAQVRRTVRALTEDRRLRRLVRLDVHAEITPLVAPDQDEPVLLLADEQVSVTEGRRLVARFREQVIRPGTGATQARLDAVEAQLCEAGAVTLTSGSSRLLDVLGPRASSPPSVVAPGASARRGDLAEVIGAGLRRTLGEVLVLDAHVRLHAHPDAVAAYASALRELRAGLGAWDHLDHLPATEADGDAVEDLVAAIEGLQRATGEVVAVDVRRARIVDAAARAGLQPARRRPLDERLDQERARSRKALIGQLDHPDGRQALQDVCSLARPRSSAPGPPVSTTAAEAAQRRWDALLAAVGSAPPAVPTEQVERLLAELAVLGEVVAQAADDASAKRFLKRLRQHRRAVSRSAQAHATITWLQVAAASHLGPTESFDAGQVAGIEHLAASEAFAEVASTWARLGKPKATRWLGR